MDDRASPAGSVSEPAYRLFTGDGDFGKGVSFRKLGFRCIPPTSPSFFGLALDGFDLDGESA